MISEELEAGGWGRAYWAITNETMVYDWYINGWFTVFLYPPVPDSELN